jgi:hypothetical protein
LHGSDQRQHEIAQALSERAEAELKRHVKRPKGQAVRKVAGTRQAGCAMSRMAGVPAHRV